MQRIGMLLAGQIKSMLDGLHVRNKMLQHRRLINPAFGSRSTSPHSPASLDRALYLCL
jgi:hypothetical protein